MTTGKQLWPGDKMRAFFRAHIARATSLAPAEAEKLIEALTRSVNRMLVWDVPSLPEPAAAVDARGDGEDSTDAAPRPAFNPYAFSAMVTLARGGPEGLMRRLDQIASPADLKALAEAQHLALDPSANSLDALRAEIVAAAERRLADRKAAAS